MKRAHRVFVAGAAACVLVACNIIAGFESEYTVGSSGSSGGEEAGIPDGPNAEGSTDAPIGPDGTVDGGEGGTFCQTTDASKRIFCEDFENSTGPKYGFPTTESTVDASYSLVARSGGSPSKALRVVLVSPGGADKRTWLNGKPDLADPRTAQHFELELDFHVIDSTLDYFALALLTFESGADREHGVALEGAASFVRLQQPYQGSVVQNAAHWFHARITLDREDGGTTFFRKVQIQNLTTGDPPVDADMGTGGLSAPTTGGIEVRIGAFNTSPDDGGVTAEFDNIVVRRW